MEHVDDLGHMAVRRVIEPRSKIVSEVIVEFATSAVRDSVKSLGFRLEGQQAGIRIELPNFLKSDFHVLQGLSYKLKLANKQMKRSVKFDDDVYGLMLDIQLPGQDWTRIRPDQARAARSIDPSLSSGPRELSLAMIAGALGTSSNGGSSESGESLAGSVAGSSSASSTASSVSGSNAVPLGRRAE